SRTAAVSDGQTIAIPTPAQLGIALLAKQYADDWQHRLEVSGECVSLPLMSKTTASIFAPSRTPAINSPDVAAHAVTEKAECVYWTAGGAQVDITWEPETDKDKSSSISATYQPIDGGPALALPVRTLTRQFSYDELWVGKHANEAILLTSQP